MDDLKNADQILGKFNAPQNSYREMFFFRAKDCRKVLSRLMTNLELQKKLCLEYKRSRSGYPPVTCHPQWAYKLADIFYDPQHKISYMGKKMLAEQCEALVKDFESKEQAHIRFLINQNDVPLLGQIAKDLYIPNQL